MIFFFFFVLVTFHFMIGAVRVDLFFFFVLFSVVNNVFTSGVLFKFQYKNFRFPVVLVKIF